MLTKCKLLSSILNLSFNSDPKILSDILNDRYGYKKFSPDSQDKLYLFTKNIADLNEELQDNGIDEFAILNDIELLEGDKYLSMYNNLANELREIFLKPKSDIREYYKTNFSKCSIFLGD